MTMISSDSGCKVGWETYDNEDEAKAREKAIERASMISRGYDFGYQWPGTIEQVRTYPHKNEDGSQDRTRPEFENEWVVCVP